MAKYSKGDYTNCRCNICEIIDEDDEIVCNVVTEDFEKVIGILEENEQLKDALNQRTEQCDKYYKENEQLKKELESFKPIIFESDGKPVTLYKKGDVE